MCDEGALRWTELDWTEALGVAVFQDWMKSSKCNITFCVQKKKKKKGGKRGFWDVPSTNASALTLIINLLVAIPTEI